MDVPEELTRQVEGLVNAVLAETGVEVVEFSLHKQGSGWLIQVLADKPSGGINSGECSQLNHRIFTLLEENQWLGEDFSLEISSPGLDRPLKTKKDFLRVLGRELRVFLAEPFDAKCEYAGQLIQVQEESIVLKNLTNLGKKHTGSTEIAIPIGKIQKAIQIILGREA